MANWNKITGRGKVEDRRGMSPTSVGTLGVTGILLMMGVSYLMGGNPLDVLKQVDLNQLTNKPVENPAQFAGSDDYEVFVSEVLGSVNNTWQTEFTKLNKNYTEPKLVLFRNETNSGCGGASSQSGPHYCPADDTIYLDETFFTQLTDELGAKGGDVAEAYVIAHEGGHHVQNLLGLLEAGQESNQNSVKTELQADCLAGVTLGSIKDKGIFTATELNEAIDAAGAVGDDRIQARNEGKIDPESWTHGSSKERVDSFNKGYNEASIKACI